jgi:hypothetical protein
MSLILGFVLLGSDFEPVRLYSFGERVTGKVLAKSGEVASGYEQRELTVRYSFETLSGLVFEGSDSIRKREGELLREGGPVPVLYLPQEPAVNGIPRPYGWLSPLLGFLAGVPLFCWGTWTVLMFTRHHLVVIRLKHEGVMAQAIVREVEAVDSSLPLSRIHYSYHDHRGNYYEGTSGGMNRREVESWRLGDVGTVRFSVSRPKEHFWVGRILLPSEDEMTKLRQRPQAGSPPKQEEAPPPQEGKRSRGASG